MSKTYRKFVKNRFEKKKFNNFKQKKKDIVEGEEDEFFDEDEEMPAVREENET